MPKLSTKKIRILFAAICVNERLARRAGKILREDVFNDAFAIYRFVLDVLLEYFDEHRKLPSPPVLRSNLLADFAGNEYAEESDELELAEVYRLVEALQAEDADSLFNIVTPYMDAFKEMCIRERMKESLDNEDFVELLKTTQLDLRQAMVTDSDKFSDPLGSNFDNRLRGKYTLTGNPLIDSFCGGTGPATGEVVGHAAVSGGGKTTLSAQTALDTTMIELHEASQTGERPQVTYLMQWEAIEAATSCLLAYGAKVPRTTLDDYQNNPVEEQIFSTGRDYKDYEKKRFRKHIAMAAKGKGQFPLAERERVDRLRKQIAGALYIVDFSGGNAALRQYSNRYVDGIEEFIEEHQLSIGSPGVNAVFVDYASACARAYISNSKRKTKETEYELLLNLPLEIKRRITNPMRCWAMVHHQLGSTEGGKAGGTRPDPTAWKGCKSFCENCDHGFVNGKLTDDTNLSIFVQAKVRRGKPHPDIVGHLDGDFSTWKQATGDVVVTGNRVMNRSEAMKMAGMNAVIAVDQ